MYFVLNKEPKLKYLSLLSSFSSVENFKNDADRDGGFR